MRIIIFLLVFVVMCFSLASAASVQGTIYDFSLNKVKNVIVEINSTPMQRMLASDSTYSFDVERGLYTISVKDNNNIVYSEEVELITDGKFNIDLFIFPDIGEEELLNESYINSEDLTFSNGKLNVLPFIIILIIISFFIYYFIFLKRVKKEQSVNSENNNLNYDLASRLIEVLRNEDGRMTQKDLRKHFPFSEAKISLVVSELEAKGKVEKIKKGRGNIIILKE